MREMLSFSHVGINVRNLEASRRFYERIGFKTLLEADLQDPAMAPLFALPYFKFARFAFLELPNTRTPTRLDLVEWHDPQAVGEVPKNCLAMGLPRFSFQVSDIQKIYTELKAEGVEFVAPPAGQGFLLTVARDPDGYLVEFFDQNMIPQYIP